MTPSSWAQVGLPAAACARGLFGRWRSTTITLTTPLAPRGAGGAGLRAAVGLSELGFKTGARAGDLWAWAGGTGHDSAGVDAHLGIRVRRSTPRPRRVARGSARPGRCSTSRGAIGAAAGAAPERAATWGNLVSHRGLNPAVKQRVCACLLARRGSLAGRSVRDQALSHPVAHGGGPGRHQRRAGQHDAGRLALARLRHHQGQRLAGRPGRHPVHVPRGAQGEAPWWGATHEPGRVSRLHRT